MGIKSEDMEVLMKVPTKRVQTRMTLSQKGGGSTCGVVFLQIPFKKNSVFQLRVIQIAEAIRMSLEFKVSPYLDNF